MATLDKDKVIGLLNQILEQELAGVVRYTHYSLLVFGYNRIPIVAWLRDRAVQRCAVAEVSPRCHRSAENSAGGVMTGFPDRQTSDS
jgi:hypothetical protein